MKQEKVEELNNIPFIFLNIVGMIAWIILGIYTLVNIQTSVYLFNGGYESIINVYAIIGFIGWTIVSAVMVVICIIGWLNEDQEKKEELKI